MKRVLFVIYFCVLMVAAFHAVGFNESVKNLSSIKENVVVSVR